MNNLKLTPTFPGGVETFLGNQEDAIEDLLDVKQATNDLLERTLLKAAIVDERYQTVITNLDMMKPVPTPDVCKAEIRREGAKLESSTKEKAIKNAPYTSHHDPYYHDRDDSLGPFDEEDLVTDAAAHLIVATQQQRHGGFRGGYNRGSTNPLDHKFRHSPWDLTSTVYQSLSPLQKQLWNEFRAARIRDTLSGTPRFHIKGDRGD